MGRDKGLQRYLRDYMAKLKRTARGKSEEEENAINRTVSRLLSVCKHPRTSSFAGDRNPAAGRGFNGRDTSATLADVDRFLCDNFNSLFNATESDESSTSNAPEETLRASASSSSSSMADQSTAVVTYSKNPYRDFLRSFQEMVDARHDEGRDSLDWDFMEELLVSYLELNDRGVHKHILRAFAQVAVAFPWKRKETLKSQDSISPRHAGGNPSSHTCK